MSYNILIIGDSGTGKSTSIRTLPPEKTFIVNVIGKSLPFRGSSKNYIPATKEGTGNIYNSDDATNIKNIIKFVNAKRPEIKYLIIDDLGYVIMNAFMKRALLKGYDRFSEIAYELNLVIEALQQLRDDLFCICTMHIETDRQGKTKPKTVGNMTDQYINLEGKFSFIFHTIVSENKYRFITNNDGVHMAKSSLGCFPPFIENDLLSICNRIEEYLNEDINQ